MKKVLIFLLILFMPLLVDASSYNSATGIASRYINNFLNPSRYINVNKGDLISKEEVEKTIVRPNMTVSSYMYEGTKFWAKDKYIIGEAIEKKDGGDAKTKVTEIVLHGTKVKGTGKYTDPWIFVDTYKVTVFTSANGMIDGQRSVTKNVDSNGNVTFTIEPNSGYKYLNNNCGSTSEVVGNILTIRNVEKDISCSVSFEESMYSNTLPVPYKVVHINLTNSDVTYRFDNTPQGPVPNTFSSRYLNGYYTDDTLTTRIGKLTTMPKRKGWNFLGYYVGDTQNTSTQLIYSNGFFEQTYQLLKDNVNKEKITFKVEPQRFKISFDFDNGTGGTPEVSNWPYEHDMPTITLPGRPGYTFDGYYTAKNGGGDKYYNTNGTESRIFNPTTPGNLTLYAKWKICPVGSYCPGDNKVYPCPTGYSTETTGSYSCTQCRYWDSCHTGENTCRYGCSTCSGSYPCGEFCYHLYVLAHGSCYIRYCPYSYSCNCSSCYYGHNTCKGAWVYIQNENSCTVSSTEYTVNLDKKGGTGGANSYKLTYYGTKPVAVINNNKDEKYMDVPTKAGYTFGGYYTGENGTGTMIVTANYVYASNYDPNKTDYTNTELNNLITKVNGTISYLDLKKKATPSGKTFTLYAHWIECPKGSRCPGDNKNWQCEPGKYQDEKGKTTCKTCIKESFQGEYGKDKCDACNDGSTNENNGKVSCDVMCPNSEHVAEWETATWNSNNTVTNACKIKSCETGYRLDNNVCVRNTFTVTYNSNSGSGTMSDSTATYNENFVTRQNAFTRSGYKFVGWNEKSDGSGVAWNLTSNGVYENGNGSHPWKWTYEKDITLYAQWEKIKIFVAVTDPTPVSTIQTGSCDGGGCYKMLYASITGISCTNNSNNTTTCVFSTTVEQTGGINTYANTMYLRIQNGSTDINSTSCEIKPYTSLGQPDTWDRTCSISFATPTDNVTYKYRAIVNNNGCILDGRYRNTDWGSCNELTGYIKNY